ncbi:helix-turn-helix domain-containing protein [Kocuria sediminis]|uniref:Helix-turn-helix domain-containing protein n=1 Tax=Kocuria sediminis TaxID=1038857 RepID=A0A6N8GLZ1_9MICC|nr:AraC family transcriptional regulator [Kocuria sediminis]MUN63779.1 helix-turn-helix domain-containing protein [Kocuria sediminis]
MTTATPANSPLGASGPRHLSFTTSDPEAGIEVLERVYAIRQIEIDRTTPFRMSQAVRGVEGLHLEQARLQGAPTGALVDATDIVRIGQVYDGGLAFTDHTHTRPGRGPFLFPVRPYACRWDELGLLSLSLDRTAVQDHAAALLGREGFQLRFHSGNPVSAAMAQYLARLITALGRDQLDSEAMSQPLLRQEAFRSAATAVLHTFPSTFLDQPPQPADSDRVPGGVRRAIAHMEEHLSDPLTLAELADAARMSPRGLQAAFARHLDTTPMNHLRSLRLAAAHTELVASDPAAGATVAAIAARWGFPHPGRFAAEYRAAYGVPPKTTLQR